MLSQVQVLNKVLQTGDYPIISQNNLTADFFFDYRAEFNYIKAHYEKFNSVPDRLTFANAFTSFTIADVNEPISFLLQELRKDYNTAYLANNFNKVKKLVEEGNIDTAISLWKQSAQDFSDSAGITYTSLVTDANERFDAYNEKLNNKEAYYMSTGLPELDKIIGGIDRKNEYMIISARTGVGKSWVLDKMATSAYKQGFRVMMYSGEMTAEKVGYRFDTLNGNIKNSALTRGYSDIKNDYENYIKVLPKMSKGDFIVVEPKNLNGPATIDALKSAAEIIKPDIVFIDQASLLEDTSGSKVMHERVANISKAIKNWQVLSGMPIILVAQMNRTKNEDGSKDTTQIGLSDRLPQDATTLLMLDKAPSTTLFDNYGNAVMELAIDIVKARDGGDGRRLKYAIDFNTGSFKYLPSEKDSITSSEELDELQNSYTPQANSDDSF